MCESENETNSVKQRSSNAHHLAAIWRTSKSGTQKNRRYRCISAAIVGHVALDSLSGRALNREQDKNVQATRESALAADKIAECQQNEAGWG